MASILGRLVSTYTVETTILSIYREWLGPYLAEVERQNGLEEYTLERPANVESYYGGNDFDTEYGGDWPALVTVVRPAGDCEQFAEYYSQVYDIEVACVVLGDNENEARMRASMYGAAAMLITQPPLCGLGGLTNDKVEMVSAPRVEFVNGEASQRRLQRSVATFRVMIPEVVQTMRAGPGAYTLLEAPQFLPNEPEKEPGERPVQTTPHLILNAKGVNQ